MKGIEGQILVLKKKNKKKTKHKKKQTQKPENCFCSQNKIEFVDSEAKEQNTLRLSIKYRIMLWKCLLEVTSLKSQFFPLCHLKDILYEIKCLTGFAFSLHLFKIT